MSYQSPSRSFVYGSHAENLAASARRFADRAFACHEQSDWEGFVVHASTAIELLAKAVLANVNILLIADTRSEARLLELAMSDPRSGILALTQTIGADRALQRARKMGVKFDRYAHDIDVLRHTRNGLMHSGVFDASKVGDAMFDAWVRSMVALTEHVGYHMRLVFGKNADLVAIQMSKYADQLETLLNQRIVAAQRRWDERRFSVDEYALRHERLELEFGRANVDDPAVQWIPCPVCGLPASLIGDLEPQADYDYADGESYLAGVYYEFVPTAIHCQTCRLNLDSTGLVDESRLLDQWELDEDDRLRWESEHWEPDY